MSKCSESAGEGVTYKRRPQSRVRPMPPGFSPGVMSRARHRICVGATWPPLQHAVTQPVLPVYSQTVYCLVPFPKITSRNLHLLWILGFVILWKLDWRPGVCTRHHSPGFSYFFTPTSLYWSKKISGVFFHTSFAVVMNVCVTERVCYVVYSQMAYCLVPFPKITSPNLHLLWILGFVILWKLDWRPGVCTRHHSPGFSYFFTPTSLYWSKKISGVFFHTSFAVVMNVCVTEQVCYVVYSQMACCLVPFPKITSPNLHLLWILGFVILWKLDWRPSVCTRHYSPGFLFLPLHLYWSKIRATSHTRLKALDHGNVRALIGRKGGDRPSSLHTRRWRPKGPKRKFMDEKSTWSPTWQTIILFPAGQIQKQIPGLTNTTT